MVALKKEKVLTIFLLLALMLTIAFKCLTLFRGKIKKGGIACEGEWKKNGTKESME